MQVEDRVTGSNLFKAIENITSVVVGRRWDGKMHPTFVHDIFLVPGNIILTMLKIC